VEGLKRGASRGPENKTSKARTKQKTPRFMP
jgi:hypothetical protein